MVAASSSIVLRRYIALELRRLRESAGFSRAEVAERLRCAVSHITHLEIMRNLPKGAETEILLRFYGVESRSADFLALVDAARKGKDWWRPFKGAAPTWLDLLLGMESAAAVIESYDSMIVPGLFQTPAYAAAIIRVGEPQLSDAEVDRRIELRMARQDVLTRQPTPPTVWCVLDESALLRPAAEPAVLAEQIEHLAKLAELPNLNLQVLPLAAGLHAGMNGSFTILTFGPELVGDPGVAYTESRIGGTYFEDAADVARYRDTYTRVQLQAHAPQESRAILARRMKE